VVKIEIVNPDAWFHVAVKNTTEWMIQGGSPNALIRRGFMKSSIPIGTEVIFEGSTRMSTPPWEAEWQWATR
jgi:hypothetical protein